MSDPIDEALDHDRAVEPSPWFRRGVMAKVRAEADLPPIAFPWMRVLVALALATAAAALSFGAPAAPRVELLLPAVVTLLIASRLATSSS